MSYWRPHQRVNPCPICHSTNGKCSTNVLRQEVSCKTRGLFRTNQTGQLYNVAPPTPSPKQLRRQSLPSFVYFATATFVLEESFYTDAQREAFRHDEARWRWAIDLVKIGVTTDLEKRMLTLSSTWGGLCVRLLGALDGTRHKEKSIHQRFEWLRINQAAQVTHQTELFHCHPSITEFIERHGEDLYPLVDLSFQACVH